MFDGLFSRIREIGTDDSIICIIGDIVHAKTDITPEQMSLVSYLFRGCSELCPTFVIPGNHDFNESNKSRMDAITPVFETLGDSTCLYYNLHSYTKRIHNIQLSHLSIWDGQDAWPKPEFSSDITTNIAMYHGPVVGSTTSTGFGGFTNAIPVSSFDGYDIVLLGDVHTYQFLNDRQTIAYPGSLIQQDFSEGNRHGMLVWDVDSRTAMFEEIPNRYGFYTIRIVDGVLDTDLDTTDIPESAKVRFLYKNTDQAIVKSIVDSVGGESKFVYDASEDGLFYDVDELLKSHSVDSQVDLIVKYYAQRGIVLSDDDVFRISQISRDFNSRIVDDEVVRGVYWKPIRFEFSNMFSYGPDNVVDFTNITGIVGLFAPNASGKSTLLDAITYCIFDRCSKTNKALNILNVHSDKFQCSFEFSIGDKQYKIERVGRRKSDGTVSVDVNFQCITGESVVSLNGKRRDETNKIIRSYIGTYDDFVLTALSTQADARGFVDMTQKDRQELLYRFLELGIYNELYIQSKDASRDMQLNIKRLEADNYTGNIADCQRDILRCVEDIQCVNSELLGIEQEILKVSTDIAMLSNKITSDAIIDIDAIKSELANRHALLLSLDEERNSLISERDVLVSDIAGYKVLLDGANIDFDLVYIDDIRRDIDEARATNNAIKMLELNVSQLQEKVTRLEKHEYDPNCVYCVRNEFVVDALDAARRLPDMLSEINRLRLTTNSIDELKSKLEFRERRVKAYNDLVQTKLQSEHRVESIDSRLASIDREVSDINFIIERYLRDINEYEVAGDRDDMQYIKQKLADLEQLRGSLERLLIEKRVIRDDIVKRHAQLEYKLVDITNRWDELQSLYTEFRIYELYQEAVHRDGIPYMILKSILPVIEGEVNRVLRSIVGFEFRLCVGDSDTIDAYIEYNGSRWPVELISGMENFILSLAIRSSLIKLSMFPKPNFLCIDEGFGVLDSDKIGSISQLLGELRSSFEFILCISHIDEMKDLVDILIDIDKSSGFSRVRYL